MDDDLSLIERTKRLILRVDELRQSAKDLRLELSAYGRALRAQLSAMEEAVGDMGIPAPSKDDAPIPLMDSPTAVHEPKPPATEARAAKERRRSTRRQGPPVPILLSYSKTGDDPFKGWVSDCSKNGLGITVEWALPVSSLLSIRPVNAPTRIKWIQVEVRNCRKTRDRWHLGCKFLQDLPPEDMELFEPKGGR